MAMTMTKAATPPVADKPTQAASKAGKGDKKRRLKGHAVAAERPRGGEARRIADLVPAIGDTAFRKFGFVQSSIITRWAEIVGARLALATRPVSLRFPPGAKSNGTLSVSVTSAHAPMVQHVLPDLIARVNQFFGYAAVARVKLVQGAVTAPTPGAATIARAPSAPAAPHGTPAAPQADLAAITDPELRAVLEGLASSLGRAKALGKIS